MDNAFYKTRLRMDGEQKIRRGESHAQETSPEEDQLLFDVAKEPLPPPPSSASNKNCD